VASNSRSNECAANITQLAAKAKAKVAAATGGWRLQTLETPPPAPVPVGLNLSTSSRRPMSTMGVPRAPTYP
jgi:hypothetical protein